MYINRNSCADKNISCISLVEESNVDALISEILMAQEPVSIGFLNQHGYNLMVEDEDVFSSFSSLNYLLRDGIGIKLACRLNHLNPGFNANGTDFIPLLVHRAIEGWGDFDCFTLGTSEPWLSLGTSELLKGRKAFSLDGFNNNEEYLDFIKGSSTSSRKKLIILAMGMPKQEAIAKMICDNFSEPVIVICGGAILDFSAGKFSRAPEVFRKLNVEWLYRLTLEPKRLFSRYVIGIPKFLYYIVKFK